MKNKDHMKLIILAVLTLVTYIPTFIWMVQRWSAADTYYSHGFLIPLISCFIVWRKREILCKLLKESSGWGWLFFIVGVVIHSISALWQVSFSSGFSLILVLIGLILLFYGKDFLKHLMFPVLFLVFMIPLPMVAIANLSFRLKIFASQIATIIVNKLGILAIREGSVIKTAHSYVVVEDPCSGIRSLIALIALGVLMAYLSNVSRTKKMILFLSSIPIALCANIIRITVLALISEIYGSAVATGKVHDVMGVLVFVFAFAGLAMVRKILE
ncbi:MAG: exosortase/archaeosortase family protein [Candidatus Omnitrophota bacterium]|jgi:exosortase